MGERKRIVGMIDLNAPKVAAEFRVLDEALQTAFDKHGEWFVREWLYSRMNRVRAMSKNRAPAAYRKRS